MIKVTWDRATCAHAGVCVKSLPAVFKVENNQLVIDPAAADAARIREVCAACPSGALRVENS